MTQSKFRYGVFTLGGLAAAWIALPAHVQADGGGRFAGTAPVLKMDGEGTHANLTLDATALNDEGMKKYQIGYFPVAVKLTTVKPASITKEPKYTGQPMYGVIALGNGPNASYTVVIDAPATGDYKIYVDKDRSGDLTRDTGLWVAKRALKQGTVYGPDPYVLRASWGKNGKEIASGSYGVGFYCFSGATPRLFYMRQAARVGTVTIAGKSHKTLLVENDGDALYSKPIQTDSKGDPVGQITTRPVWLFVDLKDDGKMEPVDVRAPFTLDGKNYMAAVSQDGASIRLSPTKLAVAHLEPKQPALLASGKPAPNFMAEGADGKTVQLSDYKGHVVILDFWATWCGPCQKSMPHLEKVWQAVKDKDVAVLGVCVWDQKSEFDSWKTANSSKYTFALAFDPAGQKNSESIASKLYSVSGIPTTYIITKDGKVADAIVGYDEGDTRVEKALKKLGIDIPDQTASVSK